MLWGFLAAIVIVVVTGYLLPWSAGQPLDILGLLSIPPPFSMPHVVHEMLEEGHELAGDAFIPLLALHVLGALKHAVIDRDGVAQRIVRPAANGR